MFYFGNPQFLDVFTVIRDEYIACRPQVESLMVVQTPLTLLTAFDHIA